MPAGALNPRGTFDASLLYETAKAGDVVRAEAEFGIDGITVVAVEPPRQPEGADPNLIELIERPAAAGVTTQLTGGGGRGRPGPMAAPTDAAVTRPLNTEGVRRRALRPAVQVALPHVHRQMGTAEGHEPATATVPRTGSPRLSARTASDRPARQPRAGAGPGRGGHANLRAARGPRRFGGPTGGRQSRRWRRRPAKTHCGAAAKAAQPGKRPPQCHAREPAHRAAAHRPAIVAGGHPGGAHGPALRT